MVREPHNHLPFDEIWSRFLKGDRTAFEQIFDLHAQSLYHYGKKLTEDASLIEDCIQDLFLELWHKKERLSQVHSVRHYLLKSLKRRILYKKKQLQRVRTENKVQKETFEISYELQLIQLQTVEEHRRILELALSRLTNQQKNVIYMKYYEKLSYDEIAVILSLNKRTVYNIVSASISELQKTFKSLHNKKPLIIASLVLFFLFLL